MRAAFKRFYCDGDHGAQFSMGVELPSGNFDQLDALRANLPLILDAKLRSRQRSYEVAVGNAGILVSDLFAAGSMKGNQSWAFDKYLLHAKPMIVIEGLSSWDRRFRERHFKEGGYAIGEISRTLGKGLQFPVFALSADNRASRGSIRIVRIILARLYLELFCFERCMDFLTSPQLTDLDETGAELIKSRIALSAQRLTGTAAPALASRMDLYDQIIRAFTGLHRPGYVDDLKSGLQRIGASPNLQRAAMTAASRTEVLSLSMLNELKRGDIHVTQYINQGQVGAMGENAKAENFSQAWEGMAASANLADIARELAMLQQQLSSAAKSSQELESVTAIAKAKEAAQSNDGPKMLSYLAQGGRWALGIAETLGIALATAALKKALGF